MANKVYNLLSPVYYSKQESDPVFNEIFTNDISISMPPKVLYGTRPPQIGQISPDHGYELDGKMYDRFTVLSRKEVRDENGHNFKDALASMMKRTYYRDAGPDQKKALFEQKTKEFDTRGRQKLEKEFPFLKEEDSFRQHGKMRLRLGDDRYFSIFGHRIFSR